MEEVYRFRNAPGPPAEQRHDELLQAGWKYEHPFYRSPAGRVLAHLPQAYRMLKDGYTENHFRKAAEPSFEEKHEALLAAGWKCQRPLYSSPGGNVRAWINEAYGMMTSGYVEKLDR